MATFTSKASGNWSSSGQTTWNETGVPGNGDTVTINHAGIIGDTNITIDGLVINADFSMATGKLLTLQGNTVQTGCIVTFNPGSGIAFNTTGGNRTWTLTTLSTLAMSGTAGAHITVSKTGSNFAWFPAAGTAFDRPTYDLNYVDFTGIENSAHTLSITGRFAGFDSERLRNCVFNGCGTVFGDHLQFDSAGNKNYQLEDCFFLGGTGTFSVIVDAVGSAGNGSGTKTVIGCAFETAPSLHGAGFTITDNYFSVGGPDAYALADFSRNLIVLNNNGETYSAPSQATDLYILADHVDASDRINGTTGIGNPHFCIYTGATSPTFDGMIFEYPHQSLIDTGDGFLHSTGMVNGIIKNSLVLPSMKDGNLSSNLYANEAATTGVKLYHNTVVGKYCQLAFDEVGSGGSITEMKSNIVAGTVASGGAQSAYAFETLTAGATSATDTVVPTGVKNNYIHNPVVVTDDVTGHQHDGFHCRFSTEPDGTNTLVYGGSGPAFFEDTRNIVTWGVHKGVVSAGDMTVNANRRAALDAVRAYILLNPRLVGTDLMPWIRAGFAPTNAALQNAGHDGVTIGAVAFGGTVQSIQRPKRLGLSPNRTATLKSLGTSSTGDTNSVVRRGHLNKSPNRVAMMRTVGVPSGPAPPSASKPGARLVRKSANKPTFFGV